MILKINNALEGLQFVRGLLGVIHEMAVELKRIDRLDNQTLDDIEHRAIRQLKEQTLDGDARAEAPEQVRLVNISLDGIRFALVLVKANRDNGILV
jgi:hypothetical protein